jgi:N-acetylglucosaminyldiphosphoundecaprenol N-acetyl-beta-D-mannosaminyltransferase
MQSIKAFGYTFFPYGYHDILNLIPTLLADKRFSIICTLNPENLVKAKKNLATQTVLINSTLVTVDGIGLKLGIWLLTKNSIPIVSGYALTKHLLAQNKYSFYLVGGIKQVMLDCVDKIQKNYPGSNILGFADGYFNKKNKTKIFNDIKKSKPDIVLVGLGSPKQDLFLAELQTMINYGIGIGIGGSFDVLSGNKKRAPAWIRLLYLEWLYRGLIEPKRIWRWRFLVQYILILGINVLKSLQPIKKRY